MLINPIVLTLSSAIEYFTQATKSRQVATSPTQHPMQPRDSNLAATLTSDPSRVRPGASVGCRDAAADKRDGE